MKQHEQSIAAAQQAVASKPKDRECYIELGMAYFEAHQFEEATAAFHQALDLDPKTAAAYNGIGRVCYHTGPPAAAIAAYEQAIALDPQYIAPIYGLGILYSAQLGDYERAVATFQEGLRHNPGNAFLTATLGSTYARMGRITDALVTLEQAQMLDPASAYVQSWLSILYLHQQRFDDAIATCQREIELADAHSPHRLLGLIYAARGQTEAAMTELEQAIALKAEDYEARAALAKLYQDVGRQQEADAALTLAQEQAEADHAEYGLACVAVVSGATERALALLKVALEKELIQPGWVRIDPEFAFIQDNPRFQMLIGQGPAGNGN
ncbi:MAG: tetratricopeptide repeat protein [Caldilineaceae bacterium]